MNPFMYLWREMNTALPDKKRCTALEPWAVLNEMNVFDTDGKEELAFVRELGKDTRTKVRYIR